MNYVVRRLCIFSLGLLVLAGGCGGTDVSLSNRDPGEVSGVVFDINGDVVRNAHVFTNVPGEDTTSNSSGSYVLHDVRSQDVIVKAEVTQDGVSYVGQNVARVFELERSKSVNIVVVPESDLAKIHGTVHNADGGVVQGARVFAIGENTLSSNMAITNSNGDYTISQLASGINYEISASSPDFRSDGTVINLDPGDDQREDFNLEITTGVGGLSAPDNLDAVAWTSPDEATRSVQAASAYEAIKRLYDPKRAKQTSLTRATPDGDIIEVDLTWDRVSSDFLLGYGVYRALGPSGTLLSDDFLRDPLAEFYADGDDQLGEQSTYSYALTSVNTDRDESSKSSRVVVQTLGQTTALAPSFNPLKFRWQATPGAEKYVVFLFDEEPRVGVSPISDNSDSPVTGTSLTYSGPALTPGHTYYYVVLALANSNRSRSISRIISFTP